MEGNRSELDGRPRGYSMAERVLQASTDGRVSYDLMASSRQGLERVGAAGRSRRCFRREYCVFRQDGVSVCSGTM